MGEWIGENNVCVDKWMGELDAGLVWWMNMNGLVSGWVELKKKIYLE